MFFGCAICESGSANTCMMLTPFKDVNTPCSGKRGLSQELVVVARLKLLKGIRICGKPAYIHTCCTCSNTTPITEKLMPAIHHYHGAGAKEGSTDRKRNQR
jgi:hypothetical protein